MRIDVYRITLERENEGIDHCLLVARFQLTRSITDQVKAGLMVYIHSLVGRKGKNLEAIAKSRSYARTQEEERVDWLCEADRARRYAMSGVWHDRPERDVYKPLTLRDIDQMIDRIESGLETREVCH